MDNYPLDIQQPDQQDQSKTNKLGNSESEMVAESMRMAQRE